MPSECKYNGSSYSEGAEVCQGDTIKRCRDGSWVDTGRSCGDSATSVSFDDFPEITEEEKSSFQSDVTRGTSPASSTFREVTRYVSTRFGRQDRDYLYFQEAAQTPGQLCAGHVTGLQVLKLDVLSRGPVTQCPARTAVSFYEIRYRMGGG